MILSFLSCVKLEKVEGNLITKDVKVPLESTRDIVGYSRRKSHYVKCVKAAVNFRNEKKTVLFQRRETEAAALCLERNVRRNILTRIR